MHSLAQCVLSHIRRHELLSAGDRVGVAVSGGIDSVALLRLLLELRGELGLVLSVVHFNHKLRGSESDTDEQFVSDLARAHDLEFLCDGDVVAAYAVGQRISLETAARELRYGFFRLLLGEPGKSPLLAKSARSRAPLKIRNSAYGLDKIVTGHTLDDQAETVVMRLIRGTGLTGLGGIHPRILVEDDNGEGCGEIVRPLLEFRRRDLEQYLKDIGQVWREDSTNADHAFTRNRVRKLVMPLLEREFNSSVAENLAELAKIARGEEDYWDNEIAGWMGTVVHWSEPEWAQFESRGNELVQIGLIGKDTRDLGSDKSPTLNSPNCGESRMGHPTKPTSTNDLQMKIDQAPWLVANALVSRVWLLGEPVAVQRRLVKAIGERARIPLEVRHIEEILRFAQEDGKSGKELSLPLGWRVTRQRSELLFVTPDLRQPAPARDYEYPLAVPGRTEINEAGFVIETQCIPSVAKAGYNPDQLLDADSLPGPLRVRNWRAGDRFWPAHTKSPKKIKELLQEHHVAQPQRRLWPVVVSGAEILWLRGFPTPAQHQPRAGNSAILILDKTLDGDSPT